MAITHVTLPRSVRRFAAQRELVQIAEKAQDEFSQHRAAGDFRMSEAATTIFISDLLNPEQRPFTVATIDGLHQSAGE